MILVPDAALSEAVDAPTREALAILLDAEVELLDEARFQEWLGLFDEECRYWMPVSPGQTDPQDHVSLFYEDRTAMELRVKRITHPRAHSLVPPVRTSHVCGLATLQRYDDAEGAWVLTRRFQVTESQGERTRQFAGRFTYHVRETVSGLRIRMKRVDLVNCESAFETIQLFI